MISIARMGLPRHEGHAVISSEQMPEEISETGNA